MYSFGGITRANRTIKFAGLQRDVYGGRGGADLTIRPSMTISLLTLRFSEIFCFFSLSFFKDFCASSVFSIVRAMVSLLSFGFGLEFCICLFFFFF